MPPPCAVRKADATNATVGTYRGLLANSTTKRRRTNQQEDKTRRQGCKKKLCWQGGRKKNIEDIAVALLIANAICLSAWQEQREGNAPDLATAPLPAFALSSLISLTTRPSVCLVCDTHTQRHHTRTQHPRLVRTRVCPRSPPFENPLQTPNFAVCCVVQSGLVCGVSSLYSLQRGHIIQAVHSETPPSLAG